MTQADDESSATSRFKAARDLLLAHREDYDAARAGFGWPDLPRFNWAADWFDHLAISQPQVTALILTADGSTQTRRSYAEMAISSRQVAGWLRERGVRRGDRVLLVLGNCIPLWELVLACIRIGAILIPATTLLSRADLADRVARGRVAAVVAHGDDTARFEGIAQACVRISVGDDAAAPGWLAYSESLTHPAWDGRTDTGGDDPLLLYFTSGTTARAKLVEHTHTSYPVGHLSTMYWLGLQPGDVHLNVSSPGWAKHAWSSVFAPWNAGATVLVHDTARFDPVGLLELLTRTPVSTLCAPPTVWRMLVQQELRAYPVPLREVVSAGEPLNREVIDQVEAAWGLVVRDGYGQTETTAQVGNTPQQPLRRGAMGRPLPGYEVVLVDPATEDIGTEGEICLELAPRPAGLMTGYRDDSELTAQVLREGLYHTGDVARRDDDGYLTYIGRADDVFKASGYRISPFALESVLLEHPAVAEAAVVPSPDPVRLAVPKAFVALAAGWAPDRDTALQLLRHARDSLAAYQRVRRLEFVGPQGLPKTVSGKIRRVELREQESAQRPHHNGYSEDDFPELRGG